MLQFPVRSDLFKASGTKQAVARDFLEIADSSDTAQIERSNRRAFIGCQQSFVHDVLKDAGQ